VSVCECVCTSKSNIICQAKRERERDYIVFSLILTRFLKTNNVNGPKLHLNVWSQIKISHRTRLRLVKLNYSEAGKTENNHFPFLPEF
jgi:hypothetical protein